MANWYDTAVDLVTEVDATFLNGMITRILTHGSYHTSAGTDPIPVATTSVSGLESAADKTKLDGIATGAQPGTVTAVTGTAPIASSGGTTPAISITAASGSAAGSMSSADYTKLSGIEAGADVTDATTVAAAGAAMKATTQYREIPIDAGSFLVDDGENGYWGTTVLSNGFAEISQIFTYGGAHQACAKIYLQSDWDLGNLTIRPIWKTASADLNTFVLEVYADRLTDGSTDDVAISSLVATVTDTNTGAGKTNFGAASTAFAITGTGNLVRLRFVRGTDTLNADVELLGLVVRHGYNLV